MMFARAGAVALAAIAAYAAPVHAQEAQASGEVRRVDAAEGKIAIKHGAIGDLDLPAMTLVYRVDPALLAGVQVGDTVKFTAMRRDGKYVITKLSK
ncbi:copper-binding protein [Castellaniella sp. GW247-6E4]|uniref:copper-binding protein n=1 Tax=Castellaniella sp. GW247-6E4 TaxID=3140380 RepID=UPI0033144F51